MTRAERQAANKAAHRLARRSRKGLDGLVDQRNMATDRVSVGGAKIGRAHV